MCQGIPHFFLLHSPIYGGKRPAGLAAREVQFNLINKNSMLSCIYRIFITLFSSV
jgi:hypothetical protein